MGPWDTFDVNTGVAVRDREYDMEKHVCPPPPPLPYTH